ncbi:MAG: DEAD/DEAH box helicase [Pseudomonadota bacterium]
MSETADPRPTDAASDLEGADALNAFHPELARYFRTEIGTPTDVQRAAWPIIAARKNALITAPTGSGKTLTAFLWALNRFATGEAETGHTSVLYISPLKALNNDIRVNLLTPLERLTELGVLPQVRVETRSGDTSQSDRQRMLRRPPEILITTPESLMLLLSTPRGRVALGQVDTVILDEIHSIVGDRRGVSLLTGLERLCWLSAEPQRIALSATVRPLPTIAREVAGLGRDRFRRPIEIVDAPQSKTIDFQVRLPDGALSVSDQGKKIWDPLTDAFKARVRANASTLFFTNSRRLAEKITLKMNDGEGVPLAYAHHGSLARDIRLAVEQRLKGGELRAIVATSSLEMGIDIGHLDEVVLIQSPPSVSASLQRIGRAGHRVGEVSRGSLFPTHAHDFLEAAALARAISARDIEPTRPLHNPLDLLAQIVICLSASEDWDVDELYELIRCASPYADLRREHYDSVIEMLAGRYEGLRIRDLKPRIEFDRLNNSIRATRGAVMAFYSSGGTIPNRGYYKLRHAASGAIIGELDEEFVWEATIGDTFNLGTGHWQIHRITHDDVLVNPAPSHVLAPPFWRAEDVNRDAHFSSYIAGLLDDAERALAERDEARFAATLTDEHGFDAPATEALLDYLQRQREHTAVLPGTHRILLEEIRTGPGGYSSQAGERQLVIHTFWGARVNRPWALALGHAWAERYGEKPELTADNDAVIVQLTAAIDPAEVMGLVTPSNLRARLRESLEGSAFFGGRFRECAGRSLLLTRKRFNQRLPLWLTRLQSKKLLDATRSLTDFPVLIESWRTCLEDEFDLATLEDHLTALADGDIEWRYSVSGSPSPFAANLSWNQINSYMYADDQPLSEGRSLLDDALLDSALLDRPRVSRAVIEEFLGKRQRTHPDYRPDDDAEWESWVKERVLLPAHELPAELAASPQRIRCVAVGEARGGPHASRWASADTVTAGGTPTEIGWLCHEENAAALVAVAQLDTAAELQARDDPREARAFASEILSFHGPLQERELAQVLPHALIDVLDDAEFLLRGKLVQDDDADYLCDVDNFEILLRFARRAARVTLEPRPADDIPAWLVHWQNLGANHADDALERLRGYSAPVGVWLHELMPPRLADDSGVDNRLNEAYAGCDFGWLGTGRERITLDYAEELGRHRADDATPVEFAAHFNDPRARYGFSQLADHSRQGAEQLNDQLWPAVWQGAVTSDTLDSLRTAERANYRLSGHTQSRRARRMSWPGSWSLMQAADALPDPLARLETAKASARVLLDRYGLVCRELANREGGAFRWRVLFPALRAMELAGEVIVGAYFLGLTGPQFATPAALRAFTSRWTPRDAWISALDPVSPSGLGALEAIDLPHRREGNHLALVGGRIALISRARGKTLHFLQPADHPATLKAAHLLLENRPLKQMPIERINDEPARTSAYLGPLGEHFDVVRDHRSLYLE